MTTGFNSHNPQIPKETTVAVCVCVHVRLTPLRDGSQVADIALELGQDEFSILWSAISTLAKTGHRTSFL
jgi:hypothetical protein